MNYFDTRQRTTLSDAFLKWNTGLPETERIKPGSKQLEAIGKTLLVRHNLEYGFWIQKARRGKAVREFCAKLHLCCTKDPDLPAAQKKELNELLQVYKVAGPILHTNTVKVAALFGSEVACAYSLLMSPQRDTVAIEEITPRLEHIFALIKQRESKLSLDMLSDDFNVFRRNIHSETLTYYHMASICAHSEYSGDEFHEIDKVKKFFTLFFNRFLDSAPSEFRQNAFWGLAKNAPAVSVVEDLILFQKIPENTLKPEDRVILTKTIAALQSACDDFGRDHKEVAARLLHKIEEQIKLGSSDPILFIGGYKKHAVLYKIQRMEKLVSSDPDKWHFSVINTGGGLHEYRIGALSDAGVFQEHVKDALFTDLTLVDLSQKFFVDLLTALDVTVNMKDVYALIEKSLLHEGRTHKRVGMMRKAQKKGTCAARCIDEWLKEALGKDLFNRFDAFSAKRQMHSLMKMSNRLTPAMLKVLFPLVPGQVEDKRFFAKQLATFLDCGRWAVEHRQKRIILEKAVENGRKR